jgi:Fe2+ or Zn2+ uptake regulation protein
MDPALRDRWLAQADQTLSGAGRRAGAARTAIVELLARDAQCLVSAQDVLDRLPGGSPSSVYRTLDELFALGLVHRLHGQDGVARYEIADPLRHHHHFIDETSGAARPFTDEELERAIDAAAERLGVHLTGHEVIIRGRSVVNG